LYFFKGYSLLFRPDLVEFLEFSQNLKKIYKKNKVSAIAIGGDAIMAGAPGFAKCTSNCH
jgi:hypothetical protein